MALLLLVAVATYLVLIVALMWVSGDGMSCTTDCSWLSDAYPWPMVTGIAASLVVGWAVAWRVGKS